MINHFELQHNELVVATDFGVVVFDRNQLYVTNSYLNIGEFPRGSTVYDVTFYDDSIFVATSQGIASALSSSNLVDANDGIQKNCQKVIIWRSLKWKKVIPSYWQYLMTLCIPGIMERGKC